MIGFIIFLVIVVGIIYLVIDDKKEREKAQEKARQKEQQTVQKIQTTEPRVLSSAFYKELLSELKIQIQKDMRNYLMKQYDEYMKKPGAMQSKFQSFAKQSRLYPTLGDITVTPSGVYYRKDGHTIEKQNLMICTVQFECSKHGYSNLNPIQQWTLAELLSKEIGYKLMFYRLYRANFRDENGSGYVRCSGTAKDAVDYLDFTKKHANQPYGRDEVYIDLLPSIGNGYLGQLMDSEIQRLQNSGVSYRSPF